MATRIENNKPMADALVDELLAELTLEVVYSVHRSHALAQIPCRICLVPCRQYHSQRTANEQHQQTDIWGQRASDANLNELYDCMNCKRKFPTGRYAQHLEKCLGMGRSGTRSRHNRASTAAVSHDTVVESSSFGDKNDLDYSPSDGVNSTNNSVKKKKQPDTAAAVPGSTVKKRKIAAGNNIATIRSFVSNPVDHHSAKKS